MPKYKVEPDVPNTITSRSRKHIKKKDDLKDYDYEKILDLLISSYRSLKRPLVPVLKIQLNKNLFDRAFRSDDVAYITSIHNHLDMDFSFKTI